MDFVSLSPVHDSLQVKRTLSEMRQSDQKNSPLTSGKESCRVKVRGRNVTKIIMCGSSQISYKTIQLHMI